MYIFTIVAAFTLVSALPVALFSQIAEYRRTRKNAPGILITVLVAAGFLAGGFAAWLLRPFEWNMPFWETARAAVDAATYGHELESRAERVLLYVLFAADLGAIAAGVAAALTVKLRRSAAGAASVQPAAGSPR